MTAWHGPPITSAGTWTILPVRKRRRRSLHTKKTREIKAHDRVSPFSVGQIIYNKLRPSIRRLVMEEPKLFQVRRYGRTRTCWQIYVLNLRKNANAGKKSKLFIHVSDVQKYQVFSDFEVGV